MPARSGTSNAGRGRFVAGETSGEKCALIIATAGVAIHVADDDHRHQIGTVPVAIEAHQLFALRLFDHRGVADRWTIRVARSLELDPPDLVLRALGRAEVQPPFGQHDGALAVDGVLFEGGGVGPVFEHEERAIEHPRRTGRNAQRVLRVVEARRGVGVGTNPQPQ